MEEGNHLQNSLTFPLVAAFIEQSWKQFQEKQQAWDLDRSVLQVTKFIFFFFFFFFFLPILSH